MNTPFKDQFKNQENIYSYFKSWTTGTSEEAKEELRKYISRIELIISCSYSFNNIGLQDNEINTYIYMLKLSESWFAYEALLKVVQENGYKSQNPNTKTDAKVVYSIQTALKLPKNFCDTKQPFGKPGFFNELKITDDYLKILIDNELAYFKNYLDLIFQLKKGARAKVQQYISYLEMKSLRDQKQYLLARIIHKSFSEAKSYISIKKNILKSIKIFL